MSRSAIPCPGFLGSSRGSRQSPRSSELLSKTVISDGASDRRPPSLQYRQQLIPLGNEQTPLRRPLRRRLLQTRPQFPRRAAARQRVLERARHPLHLLAALVRELQTEP